MSEALISVIIPVYNTQEYIVECLESLRKQILKRQRGLLIFLLTKIKIYKQYRNDRLGDGKMLKIYRRKIL